LIALLLSAALLLPPNVTVLHGTATWFNAERGGQSTWYTRQGITMYAAAGPELRKHVRTVYRMKPYPIWIGYKGRWVKAYVVDWCSCGGYRGVDDNRLVDLAPAVWHALGVPLGKGVMKIEMRLGQEDPWNLESPKGSPKTRWSVGAPPSAF
jgi:hypothetical protein